MGFDPMQRKETFSTKQRLPSEPKQIPIGRVPRALSLTVKRKNYFPPPTSVEIKNEWRCVSSPGLHPCDVYRDKFINFFLCSNIFFVHQFDNVPNPATIVRFTPYFVIKNFYKSFIDS